MTRRLALLVVTACCGSNPAKPDAMIDAPAMVTFTGQYVDWDWTLTSACGIDMAQWQAPGSATIDKTPPNGRFMVQVPGTGITQVSVTPPTMPSQCTMPTSTYNVPGIALADPAVIATGKLFSARAFTVAREMPFFQSFSLTFDRAKAHVYVHVEGTPAAVSIAATHATALAFDTQWTASATGGDVFFPDVDPAGGTTTVDIAGGAIGTGSVPLVAGKITYVTLVTP